MALHCQPSSGIALNEDSWLAQVHATFQGSPPPMTGLCSSVKAWSLTLPQVNSEGPSSSLSSPSGQPNPYISHCSVLLPFLFSFFFFLLPQLFIPRALPKKTCSANYSLSISGYNLQELPIFDIYKERDFYLPTLTNPEKDLHWPLMLSSWVAWTALGAQGYYIGQHSSGLVTVAWHLRYDWSTLR